MARRHHRRAAVVLDEQRFFEETAPKITRQAFAQARAEHPFFAELDVDVHFGSRPDLQVTRCEDPRKSGIEFVLIVWQAPKIDPAAWREAMREVHRTLTARYGPMVEGLQPPARADWH